MTFDLDRDAKTFPNLRSPGASPIDTWSTPPREPGAGPAKRRSISHARVARLQGPGGYYNVGNLLGLVAGTAVQFLSASGDRPVGTSRLAGAIIEQFAGSPSAIALSIAMLVFFYSGEVYHRAWSNGFPPDDRLNRRADALSGIGAIALGVGLLITGHPVLAATAGLLHALGKFGSAWAQPIASRLWPSDWPDLWRSLVLASRMPALLAAVLSLWAVVSGPGAGIALITPLTLIACYLLWCKADILLFSSKG